MPRVKRTSNPIVKTLDAMTAKDITDQLATAAFVGMYSVFKRVNAGSSVQYTAVIEGETFTVSIKKKK
jgi:hypothetical protein